MNIISQNFKELLKNKIKIIISTNLYKYIDFFVDNLFLADNNNFNYFNFINLLDSSIKSYILSIISSTFEEIDMQLRNSLERKNRYYINKSNVPRSITTIFGTVYFKRTLFKSKLSNKYVFLLDKCFDLPKYDHYDSIIKSIAVNNTFNTSQSQAARDISFITNGLSYYIDKDIMINWFVTFEDVINISKNRNQLSNRFVFSTCSKKPWKSFMDKIALRYDFSKIKNIALIGDGNKWIKSGISELCLDLCNLVKYYLCEFHFKQIIHHIITDKTKSKFLLESLKITLKRILLMLLALF